MPPTLAQTWAHWERAAKNDAYPFNFCPYADAKRVIESVIPVFETDRDAFTRGFMAAAEPHEAAARAAEAKGNVSDAKAAWLRAYGCYRMARFPCMKTANQKAAYRKSQDCVLAAAKYDAVPPERVEMPFKGRAGEGDRVVGYLRRPKGASRPAVLVAWAGIDTFKEECLHRTAPFFDVGLAILMIDMPGTGDSPVLGSTDGERQWDAVFDWIAARPDLDASRVGGWGGSFGGYWATKVAHSHADRFRAVISQGGGAHLIFTREQIERAQANGLPWGQSESRANAFGKKDHAEWIEYAPSLSLLELGVLDRDCTRLLCINGNKDPIAPIADYHLVLEHGRPKSARFFANGGHMGRPLDGSPDLTVPIMLAWLKDALAA